MSKKKNKQRPILPSPESLNCIWYSYDVWMDAYPESNKKEWKERACPDSLFDFLDFQAHAVKSVGYYDLKPSTKLIPVVLNDEFLKWIKDNNLENNTENRTKYMFMISQDNEKLMALREKYSLNEEYFVMSIPFVCLDTKFRIAPTSNYKIDKKCKNEIISYLEGIYGKNNIFISGHVLTPEKFLKNHNQIKDFAKKYFEGTFKNDMMSEYNSQQYYEINGIYKLCIPFVVRFKYDKPYYSFEELETMLASNPCIMFFKEDFEEFCITGVKEFEKTNIMDLVQKSLFADSISMFAGAIAPEEIMKVFEELEL